jgi:hypothetical protein
MLAGDSVSEGIIYENARRLHEDLVEIYPGTSADTDVSKLAEGGLKNLRKAVAYILRLGMGKLRV